MQASPVPRLEQRFGVKQDLCQGWLTGTARGCMPSSRRTRRSGSGFRREVVLATMLFEALTGWGASPKDFCRRGLPEMWSGFVDRFTDSCIAGGITAERPKQLPPPLPLMLPAVPRLVAIGDIHGDLPKARCAFRLAGLIDAQDRWIGGRTSVVQVGDQLDRGNDEIGVLYFLERLQQEAVQAGGALHILNGNHETMNAVGRFRYATLPAVASFGHYHQLQEAGMRLKALCSGGRLDAALSALPSCPSQQAQRANQVAAVEARKAALSPGGSLATRFLAPHPIVLQVGSTLFVHGGITPAHIKYGLERINAETRAWLLGEAGAVPEYLERSSGPVWTRDYSAVDQQRCKCDELETALRMLREPADRMVVGHTIQEGGITTACDNRVFRVDVGLSAGCGNGEPEVLEILNDQVVRRLREGRQPIVYEAPQGDVRGGTCEAEYFQPAATAQAL